MSIRAANQNDVPQICSLVISLSHFYLKSEEGVLPCWFSETLTESAFLDRISNAEYQNLVYEVQGKVVGYLALKGNSHLYHLFVSESHQGKGISRSLWQHVLNECKTEKYTLRSSLFAIPIYQKFGFRVVGEAGEKDGIGFQSMEMRTDKSR